ncbi:MAG: Gfo/Idh/MocA family oxidoreductase [Balneolaceae bacterium]
MNKVRWGILSTANIGMKQVIPAMQNGEYCSVDAISSRNLDNAQKAADELNIPKAYGSYEELLQDDEIDAIYNPLPNHLHVPWTLKALEAGKHVLCEKPIALTAGEAEHLLLETKKYRDLKVMEAFMYRFHPLLDVAKKLIRDKKIGELRFVDAIFTYFNDDPDNIRNQSEIGGGGLMDIGCYCISAARYLFDDEPGKVVAHIELDPEFGTDRFTSGILQFSNGSANIMCSTQMSHQQSLKLFGTKGHIELEVAFNQPTEDPSRLKVTIDGETETVEIPATNQYTLQGDAFSKAILDDKPVPTLLTDAVNNMKVIDALFKSSEKGTWMKV